MPAVPRRKPLAARVGLIAVGHHTYWEQFPRLLDDLLEKVATLEKRLRNQASSVVTFGMIDDAASAYEVLPAILKEDLDLLFVDMVTYATSSTWGVLVRNLNVPIVLVALQPRKAMDYARGDTAMQLRNDDFCSVPEFTGVAYRMNRPIPPVILGHLHGDEVAERELSMWCRIACALHDLRHARIGLMGHVLEAMLDMHTDPTAVTAAFGCHVVLCEPEELMQHYRRVDDERLGDRKRQILSFFDTPDPGADTLAERLTDEDLTMAARVAVALDDFVTQKDLDGLAYYYEGEPGSPMRELVTNLIVGNSMLCAAGFPMCGEFDLKTCIAMLILDRLGIGGSFAEFHPIDFERDSVLVGHDGPHHLNIAEGRPALRSLKAYHGKPGHGASVEFQIKEGPITMLGIGVKPDGQFKFIVAEGESMRWPIPATGNTNTHGRFKPDVRTFLKRWVAEGPTHHFALGVGHHAEAIQQLAHCLGIEAVIVARGGCSDGE